MFKTKKEKRKLWLASHNPYKLEELKVLLKVPSHVELCDLSAISLYSPPEEDGKSFLENACIKAKALRSHGKVQERDWILAEDSGLEVLSLGGEPGIHSARYADTQATDKKNNLKLLKEMEGHRDRKARFICQIVFTTSEEFYSFRGSLEGSIAIKMQGSGQEKGQKRLESQKDSDKGKTEDRKDFGYDPLFIPLGQKESLAQLGADYKVRHSHRSLAVGKLLQFLNKRCWTDI